MAALKLQLLLAASAVFTTLVAPGADAHGFLRKPQSRNYIAYRNYGFGCPHCGQGKGGTPSMCGDPFQDVDTTRAWTPFTARTNYPTPTPDNVLVQGSTIDITLEIWTNHGGRMQVRVCPLAKGSVTQDCFNRRENQLRRVTSNSNTNNKIYWYLRPGDQTITQRFRLPSGVSCANGCMLQWYWIGYQSCRFPCESSDIDVPGDCGKNLLNDHQYFPTCTSLSQTERYYNCADVIIRPSGGTAPPPTTCNTDCRTCTTEAAKNTAGTSGLIPTCTSCAASNGAEKSDCFKCMTKNRLTDVTSRCLSCVATRRAGAGDADQCADYCAGYARSAYNMDKCTYCISRTFLNPLDCRGCMSIGAGDITRSNTCIDCLTQSFGTTACHACARKTTAAIRSTCFACLRTRKAAGQSLSPCYA